MGTKETPPDRAAIERNLNAARAHCESHAERLGKTPEEYIRMFEEADPEYAEKLKGILAVKELEQ